MPDKKYRLNIWQGLFPKNNSAKDGYVKTCPVSQKKDAFTSLTSEKNQHKYKV